MSSFQHPSSSSSPLSNAQSNSLSTTATATTTATTTSTITPSPAIGNGLGNNTNNMVGPNQQSSGFSTQKVFYFVAVFAFIIAVAYTIHLIRRDRIKRRVGEQEDEEGGRRGRGRGHTSTYRPETDEVCPPQYQAVDPDATTIIFPDRAHQSIYSMDGNDSSSGRPLLATTATTVITLQGRPLSATTETETSGPVTAAPSPVLTLANHRQPHLVRAPSPGPDASSTPTGNVSEALTSSFTPSSPSEEQTRPTSPSTEVVSQVDRFRRTYPMLNRLRSEGPPPYISPTPEQSLPQLPPDYNAVSPTSA